MWGQPCFLTPVGDSRTGVLHLIGVRTMGIYRGDRLACRRAALANNIGLFSAVAESSLCGIPCEYSQPTGKPNLVRAVRRPTVIGNLWARLCV